MVDVMAGDGRFRYLYARRGSAKELAAAARDLLGDARVGPHAGRAPRRGLARRRARPGPFPGRIGDVVLASRDASAFVDPALAVEVRLRSGHGSLTADEMYVPLVAAPGTGA